MSFISTNSIYFFDQFSLLHFAVGIVAYFWGIPLGWWIFIHILFEIIENQPFAIDFSYNHITFWPGSKYKGDTFINTFGDTVFAILGWVSASFLDKYITKKDLNITNILQTIRTKESNHSY